MFVIRCLWYKRVNKSIIKNNKKERKNRKKLFQMTNQAKCFPVINSLNWNLFGFFFLSFSSATPFTSHSIPWCLRWFRLDDFIAHFTSPTLLCYIIVDFYSVWFQLMLPFLLVSCVSLRVDNANHERSLQVQVYDDEHRIKNEKKGQTSNNKTRKFSVINNLRLRNLAKEHWRDEFCFLFFSISRNFLFIFFFLSFGSLSFSKRKIFGHFA